jgi:hypothetical protein
LKPPNLKNSKDSSVFDLLGAKVHKQRHHHQGCNANPYSSMPCRVAIDEKTITKRRDPLETWCSIGQRNGLTNCKPSTFEDRLLHWAAKKPAFFSKRQGEGKQNPASRQYFMGHTAFEDILEF